MIKFAKFFTRSAYDTESKYWLYCVKTGIKLLPNFILKLAQVYINRGDYITELDTICADQGTISDDGNNWVDKYSGYIIKNIEFNNEEGFDDQGYRLQSREIIEKDYSMTTVDENRDEKIDTKTVNGKIVSVINALSGFIGIDLTSYKEFIINNVMEINKKNLPSKETYEKLLKKSGDKKMVSYNDALNINIITITLVYILLAIQTSIPSITTKRVFPGCIKSFSGYPLESNTDKSGLVYIACITNKIKSNIDPWSSIIKLSEKSLVKKMETIIDKYIIGNREFDILIKAKQDYLLTNPIDITNKNISIENWKSFLPPLNKVEIESSRIQAIDKVDSFIKTNITKNKSDMVKNILYSKIKFFTLDIFNSIEKTVDKNKPILSNNSGDPFLENSCCDSENNNTIEYFIENDKSILVNLNIISIYSGEINRLNRLGKALTVYYPLSTKKQRIGVEDGYSEQTIYNGFIYYCKYFNNNNNETSDLIKSLCGEPIKNIDYSKSIDEIIELYKREGRNYSKYDFENLLLQISRKNIFDINLDKNVESSTVILKNLLKLDPYTNIFEEQYIELMETLLDTNKDTDRDSKRDMKNYLAREIKNMKLTITMFLNKNSKMSKREANKILEYFDKIIGLDTTLERDIDINYWSTYLKNLLNNLIILFPTIIVNKVDTRNIDYIEHWSLSNIHNRDISNFISQYYEKLVKFYDNAHLDNLLNYLVAKFKPIKLFIDNINYHTKNKDDENKSLFDKTIVLNTLVYLFLYTIHNYLHILDNELTKYEIFGGEDVDMDIDMEKSINILLSDYIINIIEMESNNISIIDYNNKKIVDKITKSKEIEKTIITDGLRDMNDEEREIANIFKNNKLGDWNIGLQKGLTQYVKENYDAERQRLEEQAIRDKKMGDKGIVTEMNKEIYQLEQEYDEMLQDEIDQDNFDMGMIPDDGDFDPDDVGGEDDIYANY